MILTLELKQNKHFAKIEEYIKNSLIYEIENYLSFVGYRTNGDTDLTSQIDENELGVDSAYLSALEKLNSINQKRTQDLEKYIVFLNLLNH